MKRFTSLAALAAIMLTAAACGDDSSSSATTAARDTTAADAATTVATDPAGQYPQAIVSLSPTATEMLFAIGAGSQVIAVDEYSTYPAEALDLPHDLSGFEPNVEAIAALEPDLVIMQDPMIQAQLEDLGIPVWIGAAASSFDDMYTQIEQLGAATGHVGEAAGLVANMQADIAAAVAAATLPPEGLTYYHELDPTYFSVTSDTFIGQVYGLFGMTNIADTAEPGNPYPQLNAEFIVQSNPDLIFLADTACCGESPETVAGRDGWDGISAVANSAVVAIDDDIASRWGPRIVDFIEAVSAAIQALPVNA
ncbi:MAG: ABC transporter substrate-binding protein [Ilumatobacteraceae bacterium]